MEQDAGDGDTNALAQAQREAQQLALAWTPVLESALRAHLRPRLGELYFAKAATGVCAQGDMGFCVSTYERESVSPGADIHFFPSANHDGFSLLDRALILLPTGIVIEPLARRCREREAKGELGPISASACLVQAALEIERLAGRVPDRPAHKRGYAELAQWLSHGLNYASAQARWLSQEIPGAGAGAKAPRI